MREGGGRTDVLLRCDGGQALGLGHIKRCLAIAAALTRVHGLRCRFAGRFEPVAAALISAAGYPISGWDGVRPEGAWLSGIVAASLPSVLLCDLRTDLPGAELDRLRAHGLAVVTLDDGSGRRLAADLAVLPPTAEALALDWPSFRGEALIGWAWTVLAERPRQRAYVEPHGRLTLLVAMGGSDPAGLTLRCARLLIPLAPRIAPIFVIGPAVQDREALSRAVASRWPEAEIADWPATLSLLMARADLALVAYGVTAQELAAAGVPSLYLGLSDDHMRSADALAQTGAGRLVGRHDLISDDDLRGAVMALLDDGAARRAMAAAGPRALDGQGAERLAARIRDLIRQRTS